MTDDQIKIIRQAEQYGRLIGENEILKRILEQKLDIELIPKMEKFI